MPWAAIEWVNPTWGWGVLAAAGLPLLAHLFSRRGGTLAAFPALRFVEQAAADCRKLHRPRHLRLWLVRSLALGCFALAMAQPVWFTAAVANPNRSGWRLVLLLDRSASMTRVEQGSTLFADAQRGVRALLDPMDPARDVAAVVVVDDAPRALVGGFTANFASLSEQVAGLSPVLTHADAAGASALAAALLASERDDPSRTPRLVVFSDAQATQWSRATWPAQVPVTWHTLGTPKDNCSIHRPQVQPARLVAGQPARASVQVANHGSSTRDLTVAFDADGQHLRRTARVGPYAAATLTFDWTPARTGEVALTWTLEDPTPTLTFDDAVGLTVTVAPRRTVALLTRSPVNDPRTAAHAVAQALEAEGGGLHVVLQSPDATVARGTDVALLVEAGGLRASDVRWHADQAGTTIQWIDSPEAARALDVRWRETDEAGVARVTLDSPVLSVFEGAAATALTGARFARRASPTSTLDIDTTVLIGLDDGSPLLSVQARGESWQALLWADMAPTRSTFTRGPAFAPLLHQMVRHLAPQAPPRETLQWTTSLGDEPSATPGWDGPVWRAVEPSESDLRAMPPPRLDLRPAEPDEGDASPTRRERSVALWPWLLTAGLALLAVEIGLTTRKEPAS